MGAVIITNSIFNHIKHDITNGRMLEAVHKWQSFSGTSGKCHSVCADDESQWTKKCAGCLIGQLLSEVVFRYKDDREANLYVGLADDLQIWLGQNQ